MVQPTNNYGGVEDLNVLLDPAYYNAFYPYYAAPYDYATSLANNAYSNLSDMYGANVSANASMSNAATNANAMLAATGIDANASIDRALIDSQTSINNTIASIRGNLAAAAAGDINALANYNADRQMLAQLENNKNRLEVAKMAGSGQFNDTVASRIAARGTGPMPTWGGSFNLMGGLQEVTPAYANAMSMEDVLAYAPQAGAAVARPSTNYMSGVPSFSGGGAGASMPNMNDVFGGLYNQISGLMGPGGMYQLPDQPAAPPIPNPDPVPPVTNSNFNATLPNLGSVLAARNNGVSGAVQLSGLAGSQTDPANATSLNLAAVNAARKSINLPPLPQLAYGGKVKKGAAIVGDSMSGYPTGNEELVIGKDFEVIPLNRMAGGGKVVPSGAGGGVGAAGGGSAVPAYTGPYSGDAYASWKMANPGVDPSNYSPALVGYGARTADPSGNIAGPAPNQGFNTAPVQRYQRPRMAYGMANPYITPEQIARNAPVDQTPNTPSSTVELPDGTKITSGVDTSGTSGSTGGGSSTTESTGGPLADMNEMPFLQILRAPEKGQQIYALPELNRKDLGIDYNFNPFSDSAAFFTKFGSQERTDYLDAMRSLFGVNQEQTLDMLTSVLPGYRATPRRALNYA